jgi:GST-like protein
MIECYTWTTDNGYKPRMMLEETGLPHRVTLVNIRKKEQYAPDFLALSPGHKIPAIVDTDGPGGQRITLCESGAILRYLGQKSGKLYPSDPVAQLKVEQWLFYGSSTFTTVAQQFGFWRLRAPVKSDVADTHYTDMVHDMFGVLDRHLADHEFVADSYSVADLSIYSDVHVHGALRLGLDATPNLKRWHDMLAARPAIVRAWADYTA